MKFFWGIVIALQTVGCLAQRMCDLKPDVGPCDGDFERWYYDSVSESCKIFSYGGCNGNSNNFESEAECVQSCHPCYGPAQCNIPPNTPICQAIVQGWSYNVESGKCEFIAFTGCGHCGNNFYSAEKDCIKRCVIKDAKEICSLPADPGPCRAYIPSWYYDDDTGKCEKFIYGGCLGNDNRFQTKSACNKMCNPKQESPRMCDLEPDVGPCDGDFERWYYDPLSESCKIFSYGGCDGNGNNFESEVECVQSCHPCYGSAQCYVPPGTPICQAFVQGWSYNAESRTCEFIAFTGCGHCGNNFYNAEKDCLKRCGIKDAEEICNLPADPGPCETYIPSWYYDDNIGKCKKFIYGGCLGNDNRFQTKKACNKMCNPCSGSIPKACPKQEPPPCRGFWKPYYYDSKKNKCRLTSGFNVCLKLCSQNVHYNKAECEKMCKKCKQSDKYKTTICIKDDCITGTCEEIAAKSMKFKKKLCRKDKKGKCCKTCGAS